jgi:hypothetical protein
MASKKYQPTVFISYAREDAARVHTLYTDLRSAGYRPWLDSEDILPGQIWKDVLFSAIKDAEFFVICLSHNSVSKRGVIQEEIEEALDNWRRKLPEDIYLIPIRLETCDVPKRLARFQWVDLFEKRGFARLTLALDEGTRQLGFRPPADYARPANQSSVVNAMGTLQSWGLLRVVNKNETVFLELAQGVYKAIQSAIGDAGEVTRDDLQDALTASLSAMNIWRKTLASRHHLMPLLYQAMTRCLAIYIVAEYWNEITNLET